eukprot:sb/3476664/
MTTDTKSNRLICGDTAGYIAVYDIRTFCISSTLKGPTPKRLTAWHGHSSAVTGLEFVDHESVALATLAVATLSPNNNRPEDTQSASGGLQQQDQEIEDHLLNVNEMEAEAKILSV